MGKKLNMLTNFFWLIFAHAIGDMALQTDYMGDMKGEWPMVMLAHCIVWTGCICIALKYIDRYKLWKVFFLLIGHFIIDEISQFYMDYDYSVSEQVINLFDQIAHLGQLMVVYFGKELFPACL